MRLVRVQLEGTGTAERHHFVVEDVDKTDLGLPSPRLLKFTRETPEYSFVNRFTIDKLDEQIVKRFGTAAREHQ